MSADNAYAVWIQDDEYRVSHVFMSPFDDDCMYLANQDRYKSFKDRAEALVYAHDKVKEDYTEYGVMECGEANTTPCGSCYGCIEKTASYK